MTITKKTARSRFALAAVGALALAGLSVPTGLPTSAGEPAPSPARACAADRAPFGVGTTTLKVRSRGASLRITVAYPATSTGAGATPVCRRSHLIVAGHGSEGDGASAAQLHSYLVQQGYVVAAPTFPDGFDFAGYTTDVSKTITRVRRASREGNGVLARTLKEDSKVGYIGTSMGGIVGLSLVDKAGRDNRIKAVVSKAGAFYGRSPLRGADGPALLMINGNKDSVISHADAKVAYGEASRPKGFITLRGVGHDLNTGGDPILPTSTLGFFARFLRGTDNALNRVQRAVQESDIAIMTRRW